ncbi:fumarylacetoacetate hydrolase family protein [Ancylobacter sp. A5.8]|uniref:2-keto-4-pentenoate hydratase n=1 Tax=Ancylobacter gelatini TaxID=2919920 RepID=UPI001F4DC877|nr:fumarylacetoacetate hydrolase family protein [Ancylobacter gelatini]MCJ8142526.1 fumarylacetoacetate hydrolase family protein [Ancylobacter gelatini]
MVAARAETRVLPDFPGVLPADLASAYAVQDDVLRLTPRRLAGWKVAGISPAFRAQYDAERLVGPVFADVVQQVPDGGEALVAVHVGGFCAVEAEFVVRLLADLPADLFDPVTLARYCALHVGSEVASSPLPTINDLGPGAVIADHGNNAGAILGPEIVAVPHGRWESLVSRCFIDGDLAGEGHAGRVAGGPFAAVAFLARQLASRGRGLRAGDIVLTGMTTGIHAVTAGSRAHFDFPGVGGFDLSVTARLPERAEET